MVTNDLHKWIVPETPTIAKRIAIMTTLEDRPATALLVIDAQNGVINHGYEPDRIVVNIATLVDHARDRGVPVVWVQHHDEGLERDSDGWQIVAGLTPRSGEPLIDKSYGDAFEDTTLEATLSTLDAGRLVVAGAQTDQCIRSTLHGAITRGYDTLLVSDAHTTEDLSEWGAPLPEAVIAHTNLYWANHGAPGRTAEVVATADLDL